MREVLHHFRFASLAIIRENPAVALALDDRIGRVIVSLDVSARAMQAMLGAVELGDWRAAAACSAIIDRTHRAALAEIERGITGAAALDDVLPVVRQLRRMRNKAAQIVPGELRGVLTELAQAIFDHRQAAAGGG